jgi:hypothetical protein
MNIMFHFLNYNIIKLNCYYLPKNNLTNLLIMYNFLDELLIFDI